MRGASLRRRDLHVRAKRWARRSARNMRSRRLHQRRSLRYSDSRIYCHGAGNGESTRLHSPKVIEDTPIALSFPIRPLMLIPAPVTSTEVVVRLRHPPKIFPRMSTSPNHVRFRISASVHEYTPGSCGRPESESKIHRHGGWHDPQVIK